MNDIQMQLLSCRRDGYASATVAVGAGDPFRATVTHDPRDSRVLGAYPWVAVGKGKYMERYATYGAALRQIKEWAMDEFDRLTREEMRQQTDVELATMVEELTS